MKRFAILALPILLAACATTPRQASPAAQSWLVGTWLMPDESTPFPLGCSSDQPIHYNADGTYAFYGESGTWRLDGDRLTETLTEGGEPAEIGRPYVSRVERRGDEAFVKTVENGPAATFWRCPTE